MHIRIDGQELRACDARTDGGCLEIEFSHAAANLFEELAFCIRKYLTEDEDKPKLKAAK